MTSARSQPRATAAVSMASSSIVAPTVEIGSCPSTVFAAESPTSTSSTPARSTIWALG
jgi:hypothetical protein